MKEEVLQLQLMMKNKRATGRTRRMIMEAIRIVFLEGKSVVIIANTAQSAREIKDVISKDFGDRFKTNIYVRGKEENLDFIKQFSTQPVVLHDHYCFEKDLIELMKKYTMYDL